MPLVLKVCGGTWENASRDKRELSTYRDCGADVAVLAKGNSDDKGRIEMVNGFQVYRYSTRPLGSKVPAPINRLVSLFTWTRLVEKIDPDVISGHDLMPGLTIAWMATWFNKKKPKLIYDSHEFELGRNTKRNKLQLFWIKHLERFLMKRCAFSIVVNDSIADEVQRIHKLEKRPIVVRSTPEKWIIDQAEIQRVRAEFARQFSSEGTVLMYHGAVTSGRGIEKLLEVVHCMAGVNAVILGNGTERYLNSLKKLAEEYGIAERVLFHPAVPIGELWKYVGAADIGMVTIPAVVKSYYYMLPNKFFENIQSQTPIIGSDFPEIRRLVQQYGLGLVCDPESTEEICSCVNKMIADKAFYEECKKNTRISKEELCWEKEKQTLKDAYAFLGEN